MKKEREIIPEILMLSSLAFYFFGFFSLKSEAGARLFGTWKFWLIGITGDYQDYYPYFYTKGPNFIKAVFGLVMCSVVAYLAYVIILIVRRSALNEKQYISLCYVFSLLTHGLYSGAALITLLFYSNGIHACYVLKGSGRLGACAYIVVLIQCVAVMIYSYNLIDYVIIPARIKHKLKKQGIKAEVEFNGRRQFISGAVPQPFSASPYPVKPADNGLKCFIIGSKGDYKDGKIPLIDGQELIIGKDPKMCELIINKKYSKVSRKHCGVVRKGYNIYIKDYSTNGTFFSFDDERLQGGGILNKTVSGKRFNLAHTENEFYCQFE